MALNEALDQTIKDSNAFASDSDLQKRYTVLGKVDELFKNFIRREVPRVINPGGKLYTFGSYRLGVCAKGADIDTLCVAPRGVTRDDFFNTFFNMLKECPEVTHLKPITKAYVPLIKLQFNGIEMDILFCQLAFKRVPEDLKFQDDMILKYIDVLCKRSLSGRRVADEILQCVPDIKTFRLSLMAIKLWAKNKGIYSNVLGYLGGVSWALLLVKVCQSYPKAFSSTLVHKFFSVFSKWEWPQPVIIKQPEVHHKLNLEVWNPCCSFSDQEHLMPIITPAYPQLNSTYNVTRSTLAIMKEKFAEGYRVSTEIQENRAPWSKLFETCSILTKYNHFIVLTACAETRENLSTWTGIVESKMRRFVLAVENCDNVSLVHIDPRAYMGQGQDSRGRLIEMMRWFLGLKFHMNEEVIRFNLSEDATVKPFKELVQKQAISTGLYSDDMMIEVITSRRSDLAQFLPEGRTVTTGANYSSVSTNEFELYDRNFRMTKDVYQVTIGPMIRTIAYTKEHCDQCQSFNNWNNGPASGGLYYNPSWSDAALGFLASHRISQVPPVNPFNSQPAPFWQDDHALSIQFNQANLPSAVLTSRQHELSTLVPESMMQQRVPQHQSFMSQRSLKRRHSSPSNAGKTNRSNNRRGAGRGSGACTSRSVPELSDSPHSPGRLTQRRPGNPSRRGNVKLKTRAWTNSTLL